MNEQQNPHILSHYETALSSALTQTISLAEETVTLLHFAQIAVIERQEAPANKIIASIPIMEDAVREITHATRHILQQFHPLAGDLRFVLALTRCVDRLHESNLDLAQIAKGAKNIIALPRHDIPKELSAIFEMASSELSKAIQSVQTHDTDLARRVRLSDKQLDIKHKELISTLIKEVSEKKCEVTTGLQLIFIVRTIERIGDHAKAIAASAIFEADAQEVRHLK
ncbi:MAG: phosphate uptake regulator PhoU [Akkermansia sp.]